MVRSAILCRRRSMGRRHTCGCTRRMQRCTGRPDCARRAAHPVSCPPSGSSFPPPQLGRGWPRSQRRRRRRLPPWSSIGRTQIGSAARRRQLAAGGTAANRRRARLRPRCCRAPAARGARARSSPRLVTLVIALPTCPLPLPKLPTSVCCLGDTNRQS